ncbi:hypothetical protein RB653_002529 [Dictyostelium firmibasis]|uniref:Uncharacterized protein n=1 Tax=Dictyostelium firmibasis TaxID=79012 RepID=A0AAN7TXE8_9MYCE
MNNIKINEKLKIDFLLNHPVFSEKEISKLNVIQLNNSSTKIKGNQYVKPNIKKIPKISNNNNNKNCLTTTTIKKTLNQDKLQTKIINDQLKISIKCKKCNFPPLFKHDKKRWWCGKCEKAFTPLSFKILTRDNFENKQK